MVARQPSAPWTSTAVAVKSMCTGPSAVVASKIHGPNTTAVSPLVTAPRVCSFMEPFMPRNASTVGRIPAATGPGFLGSPTKTASAVYISRIPSTSPAANRSFQVSIHSSGLLTGTVGSLTVMDVVVPDTLKRRPTPVEPRGGAKSAEISGYSVDGGGVPDRAHGPVARPDPLAGTDHERDLRLPGGGEVALAVVVGGHLDAVADRVADLTQGAVYHDLVALLQLREQLVAERAAVRPGVRVEQRVTARVARFDAAAEVEGHLGLAEVGQRRGAGDVVGVAGQGNHADLLVDAGDTHRRRQQRAQRGATGGCRYGDDRQRRVGGGRGPALGPHHHHGQDDYRNDQRGCPRGDTALHDIAPRPRHSVDTP